MFAFFILLFINSCLYSNVINIPANYPTIQAGINEAINADTVLVQPGTYIENINFNGKNITVASLYLTMQDTIYISQTIIDGNHNGSVVTFENGENFTAILKGFTITNGHALNLGGGGILCTNHSSPKLIANIITQNFSEIDGGGIYCYNDSNPIIINNSINSNTSSYGGGISSWGFSNPIINSNLILRNESNYGGGIYCLEGYGGLEIKHNLIQYNNSVYSGGGIFSFGSGPYIMDNIIINNNSGTYGGGLYLGSCTHVPHIINNVIDRNNADLRGGGIFCYDTINPMIIGNLISNNISELGGGISCRINCNPSIVNCTITENIANSLGGGLFVENNSNPVIINSIFWNDEASLSGDEIYLNSEDCDPDFYYSNILGGINSFGIIGGSSYNGIFQNNINLDPLFSAIGDHPFSIISNSPCIDSGSPDTTGLYLPEYDLASNPRVYGDTIDMGAYEWQGVGVEEPEIPQISPFKTQISNYPNPFNPNTTIKLKLAEAGKIELIIYNIKGQKVKTLLNCTTSPGTYECNWNGKDETGKSVSSGQYVVKLKQNEKNTATKIMLLK